MIPLGVLVPDDAYLLQCQIFRSDVIKTFTENGSVLDVGHLGRISMTEDWLLGFDLREC